MEGTFGGASSGSFSLQSSGATAYMLMYRKRDAVLNRSKVADSAVPAALKDAMEKRLDVDRQEQEEARRKRNSVTLTLFYKIREVAIVVQKKLPLRELKAHVREALPELKDVSDDCLRLRKYLLDKNIPSTIIGCVGGVEDEDRAVEGLDYDSNIALETRPASLPPWPPATSSTLCAVKVWVSKDLKGLRRCHGGDTDMRGGLAEALDFNMADAGEEGGGEEEGLQFSVEPEVMYLPKESKVSDLKEHIAALYGADIHTMVAARANRQFNDVAISLLESLSGRLKPTDYTPLEGENFFVARVPSEELALYTEHASTFNTTPLHAAIKRATQIVPCTFNKLDAEGAAAGSHCLYVDIMQPVSRLKDAISEVVGLPPDEFRFYRKSYTGLSENMKEILKLEHTAKEADFTWGGPRNRLVIEKGAPPRQGVHSVKIMWIGTHKKGMWATSRDGGTLQVEEKLTVAQIKTMLSQRPEALAKGEEKINLYEKNYI